jgi:hypothetical protein
LNRKWLDDWKFVILALPRNEVTLACKLARMKIFVCIWVLVQLYHNAYHQECFCIFIIESFGGDVYDGHYEVAPYVLHKNEQKKFTDTMKSIKTPTTFHLNISNNLMKRKKKLSWNHMTFITLDQVCTPHFLKGLFTTRVHVINHFSFFKVIMLGLFKGGEKPIWVHE